MKLSESIKPMDTSYGLNQCELSKRKYNLLNSVNDLLHDSFTDDSFQTNFKNIITSFSEKFYNCDSNDYLSIFEKINKFIDCSSYDATNIDKFTNLLLIINYFILSYDSKFNDKEYVVNELKFILKKLEDIINKSQEILNSDIVNMEIKIIGTNISNYEVYKYFKEKLRYFTPLEIKNKINNIISESVMCDSPSENGTIIKSISNYSVPKYFTQLTKVVFSPEEYTKSIFEENDDDYLVNKIYKLPDFLKSIINKYDCEERFTTIVEYFISRLKLNTTAITILIEKLTECIDILDSSVSVDYEQRDIFNEIISYCENVKRSLSNSLDKMNSDNSESVVNSPLIEMGFSYIYDIIPSDVSNLSKNEALEIGQLLAEAVEENNIYSVLTEAFSDNYDREKEDKYEFKKRKREDKYEFDKRKEQDKYETDRSRKERKKDDKYEFGKRKKQDKYEMKKEEKEKKKQRTRTAWEKWKTIKLTTPAVYSATRALKRLLTAAAVGGTALAAGFNPVFLPIMYLISRYLSDKAFPDAEKRKIMLELRNSINIIDAKLEQAERQNDQKQKYELLRMKEKLETQYKRFNYVSPRKAVV